MGKNTTILKKGKYLMCALLLAGCALFTACFETELDHDVNMIGKEQRYQETISDTKDNDRETESELDAILEAAGDESLADPEELPGSAENKENKVNSEKQSVTVKENASEIQADSEKGSEQEILPEEVGTKEVVVAVERPEENTAASNLKFRKKKYLDEHYEKHGVEMGFASAEDYLAAANRVLDNPNVLHKKEKEDNDDVYYVEETNEFVVVSADGYIRTYFNPNAGIDYYNRQ